MSTPAIHINIGGIIRNAAGLDMTRATRVFRDAWTFVGNAVEIDMPRARDIHRNRLRAEREPLLRELDAAWFVAVEQGDTEAQATIAAQKQALRDAPADPRIEAAQTPAELEALTLAVLTANGST